MERTIQFNNCERDFTPKKLFELQKECQREIEIHKGGRKVVVNLDKVVL